MQRCWLLFLTLSILHASFVCFGSCNHVVIMYSRVCPSTLNLVKIIQNSCTLVVSVDWFVGWSVCRSVGRLIIRCFSASAHPSTIADNFIWPYLAVYGLLFFLKKQRKKKMPIRHLCAIFHVHRLFFSRLGPRTSRLT